MGTFFKFSFYFFSPGLTPGCRYKVRIDVATTANVDRSIPTEKWVDVGTEDIQGVNFIGVSPLTYVDVIARVVASENDYYKTLKIALYKKGKVIINFLNFKPYFKLLFLFFFRIR